MVAAPHPVRCLWPVQVLTALKRLINLSLNSHDHALEFSMRGGIGGLHAVLQEFEVRAAAGPLRGPRQGERVD